MFERIVVPLDGSELGELAVPYARQIGNAFGSQVDLVTVCEPAQKEYRHMAQGYVERVSAQEVIERIKVSRAGKPAVAGITPVVLSGDPTTEITDYAERTDAGLIILVSHGRSGVKAWSLGGTAYKIIQRTHKPVLLLRATIAAPETVPEAVFGKILVTLDGSEKAEAVLPYVRELAGKFAPEVTVLTTVAPGYHVHTIGGLDYIKVPELVLEGMKADSNRYLEQACNKLQGVGGSFTCEVRMGEPAEQILRAAEEKAVDLVAMTTHGHSGIERWFLGSVTQKVLQNGKTHLLLVKP
ncbi:MAG: universal stress protein [Chloroflexi bacterium]|nr:universal stress protein [Chloroflexota bacterium]